MVDAADYTLWQDNLGLDAAVLSGNGSGAATVVQADYELWRSHFGESIASGSGADHVPEPTTLLLALLALVAAPLRVRCGEVLEPPFGALKMHINTNYNKCILLLPGIYRRE